MEYFKVHHWFDDPFDETMVLLQDIVEIIDLSDVNHFARSSELRDRVDCLQPSQIGSALINDDLLRNTVGWQWFS